MTRQTAQSLWNSFIIKSLKQLGRRKNNIFFNNDLIGDVINKLQKHSNIYTLCPCEAIHTIKQPHLMLRHKGNTTGHNASSRG